MEEKNMIAQSNPVGMIGCILGFLALAAAFLSPWIREAIDPPSRTLEENVVDFAGRLKIAFETKSQGEDYGAEPADRLPSWYLAPGIIGLGLVASGIGLASFLRKEGVPENSWVKLADFSPDRGFEANKRRKHFGNLPLVGGYSGRVGLAKG